MWKEIIQNPELKRKIQTHIQKIYTTINKDYEVNNYSLYIGLSGICMFRSYLTQLKNSAIDNDELYSNLETDLGKLFENIHSYSNFTLCSGLSGTLYLLNHLHKNNIIDFDDDFLDNVDLSIFEEYVKDEQSLDFMHGSSGVVLNQLLFDTTQVNSKLFEYWLENISKKNDSNSSEVKWEIYSKNKNNEDTSLYSLGLSHGTPSLILILLKLHQFNILKEKVEPLLKGAMEFLLNSKYENENENAFVFPCTIEKGEKSVGKLAWCYGDLGCALALYNYGNYFNIKTHVDLALKIFENLAQKRDLFSEMVTDADFCHGSVGVAHIFARMYNYTNNELFRETSEYWYQETINKATFTDSASGYKHFGANETGWKEEYGLLEGISGIGLSFISAISDVEPKWDGAFLLS